MYTLKLRGFGRTRAVTWDRAEFSGDPNTVLLLEATARAYQQVEVPVGPPTGPFATRDYLAEPLAALWLAREIFEVVEATGDLPGVPKTPEGAVA